MNQSFAPNEPTAFHRELCKFAIEIVKNLFNINLIVMRKLLSSLGLLFAAIPIFAQFSGSGSGTENSPYLIYNETQLAQVANFLG